MYYDDLNQSVDWTKTKEAVANFRQMLLCSKCSKLLHEPVCLGTCEHMLCRSCAGPRAGDGCVVCHSPAWVKDIQINRQLNNITKLFCNLESLMNPTYNSDSCLDDPHPQPTDPVLKRRKNFKIWFSPRSHKVRCLVERPPEISPAARKALEQPAPSRGQDLSVFNFMSSSQDSGSPTPLNDGVDGKRRKRRSPKTAPNRKPAAGGAGRVTRGRTECRLRQQRLEAINQQWGVSTEDELMSGGEQPCADTGERRSAKRVSFVSPGGPPEPQLQQGDSLSLHPDAANLGGSLSACVTASEAFRNPPVKPCQDHVPGGSSSAPEPSGDTETHCVLSSPERAPKMSGNEGREAAVSDGTPKRPRASPRARRCSGGRGAAGHLTPPSSVSPRCRKSPKSPVEKQKSSPSSPAAVGQRSLCSPGAAGHTPQGSPAVAKRNHKGEAPLHLACIKGDAAAVKELLDQGADPNLKDNAGWTPLHEACNLGHLAVVEVLVSGGALLNTPGYNNDSPLHDAVMNGHQAIAKLLLKHGASRDVLNLHGKLPVDYAVSQAMQDIFREVPEAPNSDSTPLSPPASLSMASGCVVYLASRLSRPQQKQLAKLDRLLGSKRADAFSSSVSHIVVPDGHVPTSLSTLRGILAGCWILRYTWVEACLQAGQWIPELEHEAGEGPRRSRINKYSLLPPLFDGCFFFLRGPFKAPPKDELAQLLREGGGQLLSRQPKPDCDVTQTLTAAAYHARRGSDQALCTQYILHDPQGPRRPEAVRRGKVWWAPSTWLVQCVAAFRLLPVPEA